MKHSFLAFDLGAESGRAVLGHLDGGRIELQELVRFANRPVRVLGSLHWDVLHLWAEIKNGLEMAARAAGGELASVGLDTWGVDFGLLAADDSLLGNPYHYRDSRTDGMMERAFDLLPRAEIYRRTGIQFMQLNSLYQLLAMAQTPALAAARTLLHMPDLFNFWLCGRKASEFTIATTSQCYDPILGDWARDMLQTLGIRDDILGEIVPPGTVLDSLRPDLARETGAGPLPVIAAAGHDTAAAVVAVPMPGEDAIYLSSGTWSLMGVERRQPIITTQSLAYDFTNEGGVAGTFRFLKNIMGLWLVQECRREWERDGESVSYDELTRLAAEAQPFQAHVVPADSRFLPPGDLPARIQDYCRQTAQPVPHTRGEIVRCILESLALEYRWVAERLDEMVGRRLPVIHIIGGGSRNRLLNQLTADATGRPVVAGPVEATATGNILVQALALGAITSLAEGREVVRRSFDVERFEPCQPAPWDAAYARYLTHRERGA